MAEDDHKVAEEARIQAATKAIADGWVKCRDVPFPLYGKEAESIAIDVLAALRSLPGAGEWLAIESAPKDGTEIIAWCEDEEYWLVRWCPNDKEPQFVFPQRVGAWCAGKDVGEIVAIPCLTHWRPLPLPPVKEER